MTIKNNEVRIPSNVAEVLGAKAATSGEDKDIKDRAKRRKKFELARTDFLYSFKKTSLPVFNKVIKELKKVATLSNDLGIADTQQCYSLANKLEAFLEDQKMYSDKHY